MSKLKCERCGYTIFSGAVVVNGTAFHKNCRPQQSKPKETHNAELKYDIAISPLTGKNEKSTNTARKKTNTDFNSTYNSESPNFKGACRICGKNRPMPGDDICYHCQSE